MFFSIIVPVYNVEKYLDKCIDSLIQQDFEDYEIFLINDGSTDSSVKIAEKYVNNNKVQLINKEKNSGLSDTRNIGLKKANGDYIIFVDSDDYVDHEYLKRVYKIIIDQSYPDIVYTGFVEERDKNNITIYGYKSEKNVCYKNNDFLINELRHRTLYAPVCFGIYKRKLLIANNLFFKSGICHEDELWTPQVVYHANSVYTTDLSPYHYIRREGSITKIKDKTKNGIDLLRSCNELTIFSNKIKNKELMRLMNNHIAMLYMKAMCRGKLYRKEYRKLIDRTFPIKNTVFMYDQIKAILFLASLRIYYTFDHIFGDNEI